MVVMERLHEVREERHCNVVGGPTGSGTCATARLAGDLRLPGGPVLTHCVLSASHFLHSTAHHHSGCPQWAQSSHFRSVQPNPHSTTQLLIVRLDRTSQKEVP